jgi:hypothetical protein
MDYRESELEMARRHCAEGERHISLQHDIIAHLRELGGDTAIAERLLVTFETIQEQHCTHRDRLQAQLGTWPAGWLRT